MDEKQLRALVREEIEAVLDEEARIDSHPKFRRLVEARLGSRLDETTFTITFHAWDDAVRESGGPDIDQETLAYYVDEAVNKIRAL